MQRFALLLCSLFALTGCGTVVDNGSHNSQNGHAARSTTVTDQGNIKTVLSNYLLKNKGLNSAQIVLQDDKTVGNNTFAAFTYHLHSVSYEGIAYLYHQSDKNVSVKQVDIAKAARSPYTIHQLAGTTVSKPAKDYIVTAGIVHNNKVHDVKIVHRHTADSLVVSGKSPMYLDVQIGQSKSKIREIDFVGREGKIIYRYK